MIAAPLTGLLTKNPLQWVPWSPECEEAFQTLKGQLCREPKLYSPDFTSDFVVQTNASAVGLRMILTQNINDEEYPVLCISQKLFP